MTDSAAEGLIAAMRARRGSSRNSVTDWLDVGQRDDALKAALHKVFGQKFPTTARFGHWLKKRAGTKYGEVRLLALYDNHRKANDYALETDDESNAREYEEDREADRKAHILLEKELRANERLLNKIDRAEAKKREKAEADAAETRFQAQQQELAVIIAPAPKPEYLTETRVDSVGRITTHVICDARTGAPVRVHPVQTEAPKLEPKPAPKPAPALPTPPRVPKICEGGRWRPMTAEEAAQHAPRVENAGFRFISTENVATGWADPGGVVSDSINAENSRGRRVRVAGHWVR